VIERFAATLVIVAQLLTAALWPGSAAFQKPQTGIHELVAAVLADGNDAWRARRPRAADSSERHASGSCDVPSAGSICAPSGVTAMGGAEAAGHGWLDDTGRAPRGPPSLL
jgi:hypothetical protein